jgi:hypothetical protein
MIDPDRAEDANEFRTPRIRPGTDADAVASPSSHAGSLRYAREMVEPTGRR